MQGVKPLVPGQPPVTQEAQPAQNRVGTDGARSVQLGADSKASFQGTPKEPPAVSGPGLALRDAANPGFNSQHDRVVDGKPVPRASGPARPVEASKPSAEAQRHAVAKDVATNALRNWGLRPTDYDLDKLVDKFLEGMGEQGQDDLGWHELYAAFRDSFHAYSLHPPNLAAFRKSL